MILGKSWMHKCMKTLRENGGVVNLAIAAEGITKSHDRNLLKEKGGHIVCSKSWAKSFLSRAL